MQSQWLKGTCWFKDTNWQSQGEQHFAQQMQEMAAQNPQPAPQEPEQPAPQPDQAKQNMEYLRREAEKVVILADQQDKHLTMENNRRNHQAISTRC